MTESYMYQCLQMKVFQCKFAKLEVSRNRDQNESEKKTPNVCFCDLV